MANGSALVVAALATGALFLSGCGGGGGDKPKPKACTNEQFQLKTQSYSAQMTLSGSTTVGDKTQETKSSGTVEQGLDMENLNIYESVSTSETVEGKKVDSKVKMYLSVDKKQFAFSIEGSMDGTQVLKNCSYADLSNVTIFDDKEKLKQYINIAVTFIAQSMKCTENDGTYDTFVLDQKIPPENMPVPMPKPLEGTTGDIKETVKLTTAYMLHSVSSKTEINKPETTMNGTKVPAVKSSQDIELTVTGDAAKPNGPSADDMDYTKWGMTCHETKPPPPPMFKMFFETGRSEAVRNMFPGVEARFPDSPADLLLTAIDRLQKQSESVSTVVV